MSEHTKRAAILAGWRATAPKSIHPQDRLAEHEVWFDALEAWLREEFEARRQPEPERPLELVDGRWVIGGGA